jgi:hypothetical protein
MMRKVVVFIFLIFISKGFSQTNSLSEITGKELRNSIRLNYINISQPTDKVNYALKPNMGFVGLNYNIPLNDWLYTGAGFHTAVIGDQGGLFTLGVNLGVNTRIYNHLFFDANIHFGGGGGYRTLVNGGGILYPSAGLQYKAKEFSFGVQYGYVNFFTGIQKGDNVSFFVEIPSLLRTTSYKNAQKIFEINNLTSDSFWKKPAVKSVQQVTFDYFFPVRMSRTDASTNPQYKSIENTLSILGFEYQRYLNENTFIYAHADAMYSGLIAGFMDLFFGVGKNFIETKHVNFFAKMGIGAAGGRIFPENGLTMYPNAGFDVKLSDNFGISVHGGYHRSIGGTFEAYTAGFSLKYYNVSGGSSDPFTNEKLTKIKTQGLQIIAQNQTYFNVAKFGIIDSDLQLVAVKVLYDLNKQFYVAGEASFAYEGESGGYAHGIFGFGLKSNQFFNEKFSAFIEVAGGVAGGGRVDSGEGILVRPTLGINYHYTDDVSVHVSGGQMWSPFGNVNSSNINIGLSYGLSILNSRK